MTVRTAVLPDIPAMGGAKAPRTAPFYNFYAIELAWQSGK